MRLLHTSDWHLGQKFLNQQNREAEENAALAWLLETIRREQVDILIIAGDIFDVNNPPISAERQYYNFLNQLKTSTSCRHVVITGGNHDSPLKLNAPRELLRAFDIHVVGSAAPFEDLSDEIVDLKNAAGQTEAFFAAIPFLRERDLIVSVPGESVEERLSRIRTGIRQHFENIATHIQELLRQRLQAFVNVPKPVTIGSGHLFASGASASDEQRNIYLGSQDHIRGENIPELFDYMALGHIHRGQRVGGQERIRYSGSLIPLSFSEVGDRKIVLLAELEPGRGLLSVREIAVPVYRRLLNLSGTFAEVETQLRNAHLPAEPLPAWVKISLLGEGLPPDAEQRLRDQARELHLDILRIEIARRREGLDETVAEIESLNEMTVGEVFLRRCQNEGLNDEAAAELATTFVELQEWLTQNPEKVK